MLRYTQRASDAFQWSIGLEESDSQVSSDVAGGGDNDIPDFTGALRFSNASGHVQVGGLLRQLGYSSSDGGVDETTTGYGLNLSGKTRVSDRDALMGQLAIGKGMGRYIEAFGGMGSDAFLSADGDLEAIQSWGAVLGYSHTWTDKWQSTIAAAMAELDNISGQADDAIKSVRSAHLNLVYHPFPQFVVGGEVMWGERENFDGVAGDATRFQLSVQYKFR